jgi:hypothetical protein
MQSRRSLCDSYTTVAVYRMNIRSSDEEVLEHMSSKILIIKSSRSPPLYTLGDDSIGALNRAEPGRPEDSCSQLSHDFLSGLSRPHSEKDAKLAQKLGQLQPFSSFFPTGMYGPTCTVWANLTPLARAAGRAAGCARAGDRADRTGRPGPKLSGPARGTSLYARSVSMLRIQLGDSARHTKPS